MIDHSAPYYFAVFHSPGSNWLQGVPYNRQPDLQKHIDYMSGLHDQGRIVISGPFMKKIGGELNGDPADGGMAILKAGSLDEATRLANEDPTIRSGMIQAEVKILWVPFHD